MLYHKSPLSEKQVPLLEGSRNLSFLLCPEQTSSTSLCPAMPIPIEIISSNGPFRHYSQWEITVVHLMALA